MCLLMIQYLPVLGELPVTLSAQGNGSIWKSPAKLGADGGYQVGKLPMPRLDNALPRQASDRTQGSIEAEKPTS